jgi:hypothetical protein
MRTKNLFSAGIIVIVVMSILGFSATDNCEPITRTQLRQMLVQLGYEVKDIVTDPGKEKYSITLTKYEIDIPVGAEISPSGKYIWLTVNLGNFTDTTMSTALLRQNGKIQPTQFYATESGRLMVGLPIENRGVDNVLLREKVESITNNTGKTKGIWQR